jgi:hypothetical protein
MKSIGEIVWNAIDWTSMKLTGVSVPFLMINYGKVTFGFLSIDLSKITAVLGFAVLVSTLLYNAIRIYKELKNK